MIKFLKLFKKVGGIDALKQYQKAGVLFFALIEFLRSGFSQKSLEISRLSIQYKIQRKLRKKYSYVINKFDKNYNINLPHIKANRVWICWLQGMENAPLLVQRCYESIKTNLKDKEIVVITLKNIFEYVDFPDYILDKWHSGIISNTHFSDLLRLELLIKYGGTWIDATVLCTDPNPPEYILNSDLFLYQILKPGKDGHAIYISSWLITASSNNKILLLTREFIYEYWKKNNIMVDYLLLHQFMCIAGEAYHEEWSSIPKASNSVPHILLLELHDKYNKDEFKRVCEMTCFHKLSYKFSEELLNKNDTFYDHIINKANKSQ